MANAVGTIHPLHDKANKLRAEQKAIYDDYVQCDENSPNLQNLEARLVDVQNSLGALYASPEYQDAIASSQCQCGNDWGGF